MKGIVLAMGSDIQLYLSTKGVSWFISTEEVHWLPQITIQKRPSAIHYNYFFRPVI